MKRDTYKTDIYKVFTLFDWNECFDCGKEFRRESGWGKNVGPFYGGKGREKCACKACAPSIEAADALFDLHQKNRMKRPPGPPNPPIKTNGIMMNFIRSRRE